MGPALEWTLHSIITRTFMYLVNMDDGGVDKPVIDSRQNQLGQMADFPPLLTF